MAHEDDIIGPCWMIQKGVNFSSSSFLCLSASTHGKFMTNLADELDGSFYDLTEYEITLGQRHQDLKQHFNTQEGMVARMSGARVAHW